MPFVSFRNMLATSGIILWVVITAGLLHEFETFTAVIISIISLLSIWWVTKSLVPLAYEGMNGKMMLMIWLVITGIYVAAFDPFAAMFLAAFAAAAFWSCTLYMASNSTE